MHTIKFEINISVTFDRIRDGLIRLDGDQRGVTGVNLMQCRLLRRVTIREIMAVKRYTIGNLIKAH